MGDWLNGAPEGRQTDLEKPRLFTRTLHLHDQQGKTPYQAILDGGTSKMRPVCMVVLTTVLGSIPLLTDPFFGAMAVCIIFGLVFAAFLALIVMPIFYAIFFGVRETAAAVLSAPPMRQSVEVKES